MKQHTDELKQELIKMGKQIDSIITYEENNEEVVLHDELYAVTPHYEANILKSVMKQLDVESSVDLPLNTVINYKLGVLVGNDYEYLDYGNYIVYKSEKKEDTKSYMLTCYDKMLYSMKQNEDLGVVYPISIKEYLNALASKIGLEVEEGDFQNQNLEINQELYLGLEYTYRDILDEIAQATGSIICISKNDKIEVRYIGSSSGEITQRGNNILIQKHIGNTISNIKIKGETRQEQNPSQEAPKPIINIESENIFDNYSENILKNKKFDTNGNTKTAFAVNISDYMGIKPNTNYLLYAYNIDTVVDFQVCFYDKNKNFISYVEGSYMAFFVKSPNNAFYARFSYPLLRGQTIMFKKFEDGSTIPTYYTPYNCIRILKMNDNIFNYTQEEMHDYSGNSLMTNNINYITYYGTDEEIRITMQSSTDIDYAYVCFDLGEISNYKGKTLTLSLDNTSEKYTNSCFVNCTFDTDIEKIIPISNTLDNNKTSVVIGDNYSQNRLALRLYITDVVASQIYYVPHIKISINDNEEEYVTHEEEAYDFPLEEGQILMEESYIADDGIHNKHKHTTAVAGISSITINDMKSNGGFYSEVGGTLSGKTITFVSELTNDVDIEYELDEEEIIPFTEEQQTAWENISSMELYEGSNYIVSQVNLEISNQGIIEDTIDENYLKDINVTFGQKYGPINSVVLSRSAESDNVYLRDEDSIIENGLCEIKIIDNQIMNWNDRSDYLQGILDAVDGIEYYINDFTSLGILYYDVGDFYNIKIGENTYKCLMLNDEINVTQGIQELVYTDMPEESETDYDKADRTDRRINQAYIIVDKQNQTINSLVETTEILNDNLENGLNNTNNEIENLKTRTTQVEQKSDSIDLRVIDIEENGTTKVQTTMGYTFDNEGLKINKTDAETGTIIDESAIRVIDKTGYANKDLLYAGYVKQGDENYPDYVGQTIVYSKNMIVEQYLVVPGSRFEAYQNPVLGGHGTGVFEI